MSQDSARDFDPAVLGRRVRDVRRRQQLTLEELSALVGKKPAYLSLIETGKREPKLSAVMELASALNVPVGELLAPEPPTNRDRLELELARMLRQPAPGLPALPAISPNRLPEDVLEHLVAVHRELRQHLALRAATPEEARKANAQLRGEMRARGNYFAEIDTRAGEILGAAGYGGSGPLDDETLAAVAAHLGFTIESAADVPASVRSVTDLHARRIYLPEGSGPAARSGRSVILHTLGHFVLEHSEPRDFGDFLRQRVESNYFAGALLVPESAAVPLLQRAREERALSVENLREPFGVSYEMAAHRLTNLATRHLGIRTHFLRSDEDGVIWKAYENDGVPFPMDADGAIEGNLLCRKWGTRAVFAGNEPATLRYQLTDTPGGTFWCSTQIEDGPDRRHAITIGARFEDAIYFQGRGTRNRVVSTCPAPECCHAAPDWLARKWDGYAWPNTRAHSHVLAALPVGRFPGVAISEIYEFLERHE